MEPICNKLKLSALIGILLISVGWAGTAIIPAVRTWRPAGGSLQIGSALIEIQSEKSDRYHPVTSLFSKELREITTTGGTTLFKLNINQDLDREAYTIDIGKDIKIGCSTPQGAFYATRTLLQMLMANGNGKLPCGTVKDKPAYPVRSVLLDVGRKFMPVEQLKDWIRMMGWLKLNELHLHLNDNSWGRYPGYRLESRTFPDLPSKDGHYTFEQIRELQDFAALHGVSIVPEIDSPGHALAFTTLKPELAHPALNHPGFGLCYLDIRKDQTYRFMEAIFDEVAPLFDSKYIHIGTDEYLLKLIPDDSERKKTGEQFRQYINHFANYLQDKHGKTVRIWSGYEHMPGTTEPDTSIVIDMWETTDAVNKSKAGYRFVNSSHFYTYIVPGMPYYGVNDQFLYETWTPLIFNMEDKSGKLSPDDPGLLGGKLHIWNDAGPTGYTWNEIARLTLPSMMAISEKLWGTKGSDSFEAFTKRMAAVEKIPNVELLTRNAKADADGVIWSHKGDDLHFIANTHHPLDLAGEPKNLEYPWTASFTLTRQSDAPDNDVLLSSELASFYLDLTQTKTDKKTKEMPTRRGVGCVRAVQAPGFDPLTSFRPDGLVFDYTVPFDKKVTLTFVGEERKTSLYVDGKLIGSHNIQMVCPLETLGDKHKRSFQGILHEAQILNEAKKPDTSHSTDHD
ncbi:MAG: family 20 glycosylhydrolase [Phycisphaerae bacterium]|nr:family 20 glycosylhydrolase [Phycisphaerae bacterium]